MLLVVVLYKTPLNGVFQKLFLEEGFQPNLEDDSTKPLSPVTNAG